MKIYEIGVSGLLQPTVVFSSGSFGNDPFRDPLPKICFFLGKKKGFAPHFLISTPTFLKDLNNPFEVVRR